MFFEFVAAVVAGAAAAAICAGARRLSGGWISTWAIPAVAGLAMLSYAIWSEYSWFSRSTNSMAPGVVVTWAHQDRAFWRPWSYFKPVVDRFAAIDTKSIQHHPKQPEQAMVEVLMAARWRAPARIKTVYDCGNNRRANLFGTDASVAEDGTIIGAIWTDVPDEDRIFTIACVESKSHGPVANND